MSKAIDRREGGEKEVKKHPIKEPVELLLPDNKSLICAPWGVYGDPKYTPVRDQAHRVMLISDGLTATRLQHGSGPYEVSVTVQGLREEETLTQGWIVHGNGDSYEYSETRDVAAKLSPITEIEDSQFDIFADETAFPFLLSDQIYTITMGETAFTLRRNQQGHTVIIKPDGTWDYFSSQNGMEVRTFGRNEDRTYMVGDNKASRKHATIVRIGNVFAIKDTSTNGTHIDIKTPQLESQRRWARPRWGR